MSRDHTPDTQAPRWLAILVGPVIALLLYAPTLDGTFLSDDFLTNTMLDHGPVPQVLWSEVFADFGRPWAGIEGLHLYRPLVSVSFAACYALGGTDPFVFHLFNILVHALATLSVALLCASCSHRRASTAAALGGVLFAVHPVAAEPVCWVASRTAGMQVMFATAAMACFARHLRLGGRGPLAIAVLSFVAALMCKESAVLVPLSCAALDLLIRGKAHRPGRLVIHGWMFGVLAGYFLLRRVVLGTFIGGETPGSETLGGTVIRNLLDKFILLLAPVGNSLPTPWGLVGGIMAVLGITALLLPALGRREARPLALLGVAWIALYFAPTYRLSASPENLGGSRMVYGAVVILAIWIAGAATRSHRTWLRIGSGLLLFGLLLVSVGRMEQYRRAYDDMRHLQASLAERAEVATEERPLAFVSVAPPGRGIPFLNCNALYPLAELPVAKKDTPSVSLGFVLQPVPLSESLLFDIGPVRAMREQGAYLLDWVDHPKPLTPAFELRPGSRPDAPAPPRMSPYSNANWFVAERLVDPWNVEVVEIEVQGPCQGGRLEWLFAMSGDLSKLLEYTALTPPPQFRLAPSSVAFTRGETRGPNTVFYVDVSHNLTFVALRLLGGLAGVHAVLDGDAKVTTKVTTMRLHKRVGTLPLPLRVRGAKTTLATTADVMRVPALPADAERMTLYLVGPDTTIPVRDVQPGPFQLSERLQKATAIILRSSRQKRWYFYFEANGLKSYRSAVDWVVFER